MGATNFPDGLNIGSAAGGTAEFQLGTTVVTSTPAELNILDGVTATATELNYLDGLLGNALAHDASAFQIVASGSTTLTGAGTIATGLGGTVQQVIASIANGAGAGTATVGDPAVLWSRPVGTTGGSVAFEMYDNGGSVSSVAGTIHWVAFGTGA